MNCKRIVGSRGFSGIGAPGRWAVLMALLAAAAIIAIPLTATAENICVAWDGVEDCINPAEYDFGDVETGELSMVTFSVTGTGFDSIVWGVEIIDDETGAFAITSAPEFPNELGTGSITVDVEFAPGVEGADSAALRIDSTDDTDPWYVNLSGNGVSDDPPPLDLAGLIALFDEGLAEGTIFGTGGHPRAQSNHEDFVRRRIERASTMLDRGSLGLACFNLFRAYLRSDGQQSVRDFVEGPEVPDFAAATLDAMDELGCP